MSAGVLTLSGVTEAMRDLSLAGAAVRKAAAGGLYQFADGVVMSDAKDHYVPWEEGILRDSGHVELPVFHGSDISVALGFGGAAKDYAAIQHERMDFRHPRGGGPKYLERPMLKHAPAMPRFVADAVDDVLRSRR